MSFRPSKITKFFPLESSSNPYRFFTKNVQRCDSNPNIQSCSEKVESVQPCAVSISQFDHFPIALVTLYEPNTQIIYYSLYINYLKSNSISNKIINIDNQVIGDLKVLIESLHYLVYNPNTFKTINRQKIGIYTNSITIANIFKPISSFIFNNDVSKAYFKIQALLKCIKHIFVEFKPSTEYPCSEAIKLLHK